MTTSLIGLLKTRLWSSVVQTWLSLILVWSSSYNSIHATARRWPRTQESCPVRLRSNSTGATCACSTATINEIRCSGGLNAVPEFLPSDHVFHALYLSKQNINEVIQGSFANLQVGLYHATLC